MKEQPCPSEEGRGIKETRAGMTAEHVLFFLSVIIMRGGGMQILFGESENEQQRRQFNENAIA